MVCDLNGIFHRRNVTQQKKFKAEEWFSSFTVEQNEVRLGLERRTKFNLSNVPNSLHRKILGAIVTNSSTQEYQLLLTGTSE